jgi:hypothetical protein
MHPVNPLSGNAAYSIILLCLTSNNFSRQGESAVTQCVKVISMSLNMLPHLTFWHYLVNIYLSSELICTFCKVNI